MKHHILTYTLRLADNALILGHRISEWTAKAPELELDMAMQNIALDLLGEARALYQYASELDGQGKSEDYWPYLRKEKEFVNLLLVEQPNGNFADTIARQFLYDVYHFHLLEVLQHSNDALISAVAQKSIKEAAYHKKWSAEWVIRLGDGSDESHLKMKNAIAKAWNYTGELFKMDETDTILLDFGIAADLENIKALWQLSVKAVLTEATLDMPETLGFQKGGREGRHSEHLGFLLTELQYMQRTYPNMTW
jgi:ring-1,2-phenylacetyl-CoA epoxidase subunit PaaC